MKKLLLAMTVVMTMASTSAHAVLPFIAWPVAHATVGWIAATAGGTGLYIAGTASASWTVAFILGNAALLTATAGVLTGTALVLAYDQYKLDNPNTDLTIEEFQQLVEETYNTQFKDKLDEAKSDLRKCKWKAQLNWNKDDRRNAKANCNAKYGPTIQSLEEILGRN